MSAMLTDREVLIALTMAAKEAGVSYGKFVGLLTEQELNAIYKQYAEQQKGRKGRAKTRVGPMRRTDYTRKGEPI